MHYFLLAIGVLLGLYGLYRFFTRASVAQIKGFFITAFFIVFTIAVFYLAITGRLPAAIALMVALIPFLRGFLRKGKQGKTGNNNTSNIKMSKKEAYEVLGLDKDATEEDIQAAYKKLIKKLHPDQEGSEWMAAKLNEARDLLSKK